MGLHYMGVRYSAYMLVGDEVGWGYKVKTRIVCGGMEWIGGFMGLNVAR